MIFRLLLSIVFYHNNIYKFRCPRNARFRGAMSSQQHTGTQEVCYWYLGARPSRGARARARACPRGPPRNVLAAEE